ncbi:MAG: adenylate/guanylate cyclase domain-containing protein [Sphingobium sp.]
MISFFRSISTKIFGIAFGLLIVMLVVSAWSATAIESVNRQLATLGQSLVPLALSVQNMRSASQDEYLLLETHAGPGQSAACRRAFAVKTAEVHRQIREARKDVEIGVRIAWAERNKIQLARMSPMIDQVANAHRRYTASAGHYCDAFGGPDQADAYRDNHDDARWLRQLIDALALETQSFARKSALIVKGQQQGAIRANSILIAAASVASLLLAYLVSRGVTRPIARLREGTRSVEAGRLDGDVPITSKDEIGDVTRAFNDMLGKLREKELIKETFGQYVDPRVVSELIGGDARRSRSGTKQVASLFFSDIEGFTSLAERLAPATLVNLINAYFGMMSAPIRDGHGIIDKFIGDSIMAFWVPPFVDEAEQAVLACSAALAQFDLLADFRKQLPDLIGLRRDIPVIDVRVAIASGEVLVGSIGPDFARSFTVMGDTVNFASRLESVNKVYGTRILIDEMTADMAGNAVVTREIDRVQVIGRDEPLRIFELVDMAGATKGFRDDLFGAYAAGLAAYRTGDWPAATTAFETSLGLHPTDGPSRVMLTRVERLVATPPPEWDGIWKLGSK